MPTLTEQCSVMNEISRVDAAIKNCYDRIRVLEQKVESENFTSNQKEDMRRELVELQKLLTVNEQQLSNLHKDNRKSFGVVAALCFVCFFGYVLYVLVFGLS